MGDIQIFNADYREIVSKLENKSIDLLLTDPPYMHVKGGCKSKTLNVGCMNPDKKVVAEMSDFGKDEIYTFLNLVKPKMKAFNAYIFCSKLQIPYYLNWALEHNIQFDVLIWDKCHTGIHSYKFYSTKYEYIIRLYKTGLYKVEDNMLYQKVQRYKVPHPKIHISQKPEELIRNLMLVSTLEGDTVLDCFAGSGTVAKVAKEYNRKCISTEKDSKCFNIMKELIDN